MNNYRIPRDLPCLEEKIFISRTQMAFAKRATSMLYESIKVGAERLVRRIIEKHVVYEKDDEKNMTIGISMKVYALSEVELEKVLREAFEAGMREERQWYSRSV